MLENYIDRVNLGFDILLWCSTSMANVAIFIDDAEKLKKAIKKLSMIRHNMIRALFDEKLDNVEFNVIKVFDRITNRLIEKSKEE